MRSTPMSQTPISPLRQRMIEDMTVRNFIEKTRNDYIRHVRSLAAFLRRSPDTATPEDLRRFQLHQTQTGVRPPSINAAVAALRFFFTVTLDRPDMARHVTVVREPRRIPAVLSPDEMLRLLEAAPGPKYKAALSAAYGAGLRVSEVVALKVSDVDSGRMLLKVEQGKTARTPWSPITAAVTATAPSARQRQPETGWRHARLSSCRCLTSTWSSRCQARSPTSPTTTKRRSTTSCSRPQPRPCSPSRPIPGTWAPTSASPPFSTPGARR